MRRSTWKWAGMVAAAFLASKTAAQTSPSPDFSQQMPSTAPTAPSPGASLPAPTQTGPAQPVPNESPPPEIKPAPENTPRPETFSPGPGTIPPGPNGNGDPCPLTGRSRYDTVIFPNNPAVTGIGLASATATQAASTTTFAASPLILPGLLTAAQAESARPMDRVFFDYGFFDSMRTLQVPTPGLRGL